VGAVVPAFNEERQIGIVLETMPDYVDSIVVVDDCSKDETVAACEKWSDRLEGRLILLRHHANRGVGGAITTGFREVLHQGLDIAVVMAGDGQMNPDDLPELLEPIICDDADYSKGNRMFSGRAWQRTPKIRYLGSAFLSMMTKIASGYWHVADSQNGYTASRVSFLRKLDLGTLHQRYAFENDMLIQLNIHGGRVVDVPMEPRYGIGERSSMRILRVIPDISWVLFKGFLHRLFAKYVIRDFHPLIFFYFFGTLLLLAGLGLGVVEVLNRLVAGIISSASITLVALLMISGLQLLLFAMWFDMEYSRSRFSSGRPQNPERASMQASQMNVTGRSSSLSETGRGRPKQ
jgi:glycosyltransferase involved in cell wall biosynthesis